jgi:hypothetical protein
MVATAAEAVDVGGASGVAAEAIVVVTVEEAVLKPRQSRSRLDLESRLALFSRASSV